MLHSTATSGIPGITTKPTQSDNTGYTEINGAHRLYPSHPVLRVTQLPACLLYYPLPVRHAVITQVAGK